MPINTCAECDKPLTEAAEGLTVSGDPLDLATRVVHKQCGERRAAAKDDDVRPAVTFVTARTWR